MKSLKLNAIDPVELMPPPEVPERFGPRDEDERRVYDLVKEALDDDDDESYDSVADLIEALRAGIPQPKP